MLSKIMDLVPGPQGNARIPQSIYLDKYWTISTAFESKITVPIPLCTSTPHALPRLLPLTTYRYLLLPERCGVPTIHSQVFLKLYT